MKKQQKHDPAHLTLAPGESWDEICKAQAAFAGQVVATFRLHEAAPDLLEALKGIIDMAEEEAYTRRSLIDSDETEAQVQEDERKVAAARAAIAKAGGGE